MPVECQHGVESGSKVKIVKESKSKSQINEVQSPADVSEAVKQTFTWRLSILYIYIL